MNASTGFDAAVATLDSVDVVASPEAVQLVQERGGKLFVWAKRTRCCRGGLTFLEAATEAPEREFRRFGGGEIELYLDERLQRLPDELHLEVKGRRQKRVEVFWDGCAYVV